MAGIYGALGLQDNDRTLISQLGQQVVYDVAIRYIEQHNAELQAAYGVFVEGMTEGNKDFYKLPGTGRMQRLGRQSSAGGSKTRGRWDVAFPLEGFGESLEYDKISFAYLTVEDFNNELNTIRNKHIGTHRWEMLAGLFNNSARTFIDEFPMNPGSLTIQPLANGDSVKYPLLNDTQATDNHYLVSGYTAIDDTNNPLPTMRRELEEHFGTPDGYGGVISFWHEDQINEIEALADFVEVEDVGINYGDDTSLAAVPQFVRDAPGRTVGRCNGVWIKQWWHIPSGYGLAIDGNQPGPLKKRVHPANLGLPQALTLVAEDMDNPIATRDYEDHFGYGVANRLNGVIMQIKGSGTYDVPSKYQR